MIFRSLVIFRFIPTMLLSIGMFSVFSAFSNEPQQGGRLGEGHTRISTEDLLASVKEIPAETLLAPSPGKRSRALLSGYYESIREWGSILEGRIEAVPGHPGRAYYGRGGNREDDVRPIAYAAMVNAFLSEVQPPAGGLDEEGCRRKRGDAMAALRYLTQAHVAGKGACLDGKPWGNQWQSAMWCRAAGMAGWMLWKHLDRELKIAVARMVEHEADRFLDLKPKSRVLRDTGAEENAWNALATSLAANMMPGHPRAGRWDEAAKKYLYNTFSVEADQGNRTPGDDGRLVSEWVTTVNAHPDFTVENHGIVHVGYLKNALATLCENTMHYLIREKPCPAAVLHHAQEVFEVLKKCMSWDGAAVYFGGNDWKIIHTQCTDVVIYAAMSRLALDPAAAYLEEAALRRLRDIQEIQDGFYNIRRDLEYGGLSATRLICGYFIHALLHSECVPVDAAEFNLAVSQVTCLERAKAVIHRTPTKFASFAWGPKRMALALPENGSWVVWPHFASYLGYVNGEDSSARHAKLMYIHQSLGRRHFSVTGALSRCDERLVQEFSYASLSKDVTVYIERLTAEPGFILLDRATGVIGHEYELGGNKRTIHGEFGSTTVQGVGGRAELLEWETAWLNLGGRVGYVVKRVGKVRNLVRYRDESQGEGRVPKLQEWLSLVGEKEPGIPAGAADWACIVTFLNQEARETAQKSNAVLFEVEGGIALCRIGKDRVRVDFQERSTEIEEAQ